MIKETREPEFVRIGFNEPIWILFSSGTTGTCDPSTLLPELN